MKQIEFKTSKGEFVVIELYDTIDKSSLSLDNGLLRYRDHIGRDAFRLSNQECANLGSIPDLTEEQAFFIVDDYDYHHNMDLTVSSAFKDYVNGISEEDSESWDYWDEYPFDNAIDSLHSLLEANGVVFENPVCILDGTDKNNNITWLKAQSKVWNREQIYLFKKI